MGGSSNGKTPALQAGDRGSTPRLSTLDDGRKAAGYGWPGLVANECARKGVRVRIPRLPLSVLTSVPMVKRRSPLGPNEEFRVRFLVGTCRPDGETEIIPRF